MVGYCSMYYAGSFIAGILTDYFSYSGLLKIYENENENVNENQENNKFFKKTEQIENENKKWKWKENKMRYFHMITSWLTNNTRKVRKCEQNYKLQNVV